MEFEKTEIEGCYKIITSSKKDNRGNFIKIFNYKQYLEANLGVTIKEQYYSISKPNVLRGMHFQLPPSDHFKIVTCLQGKVLDVVVDLRVNSPTYHKATSFILQEDGFNSIYIPRGLAHGFYVLGSKDAIMLYNTETEYDPTMDFGIKYDSIDFKWPFLIKPIVSDKDDKLPIQDEFESPF